MKIFKSDLNNPKNNTLKIVAQELNLGGVCVLPTDTSYGICARADNPEAVKKIFKIKKREREKSLSVFVGGFEMINKIADVDFNQAQLLKKYLPGSFTFILPKKESVLVDISHNNKIGIRFININLFQRLFEQIDFPITATSANISQEDPIYDPDKILKTFQSQELRPDIFLDCGILEQAKPSTIVDLTFKKPKIIRQGQEKFSDA
jgi:L-threonylcarbamoyladenylate synthase